METTKLHAFGEKDHLKILKEKYYSLKSSILGNSNLDNAEKKVELKDIKESFKKEKSDSTKKNY